MDSEAACPSQSCLCFRQCWGSIVSDTDYGGRVVILKVLYDGYMY